jgi:hypothetical protein
VGLGGTIKIKLKTLRFPLPRPIRGLWVLWGPAPKPPASLRSKKRALEQLISIYLSRGGIPRGHPPGTPVFSEAFSRPVNSRIGIDSTFTGPKVIRIVWEDHVISFLLFFNHPDGW